MYGEMPPAEKEAWNQRAEADKARFLHELSNYSEYYFECTYFLFISGLQTSFVCFLSVPPPGYDLKGDANSSHSSHPAPKRRGGSSSNANKTTRDPNAPKRNMSAYLLYQNCMREQFKAHNPGMTFGQVSERHTRY
jgi:hypothetical protein